MPPRDRKEWNSRYVTKVDNLREEMLLGIYTVPTHDGCPREIKHVQKSVHLLKGQQLKMYITEE